MKIEILLIFPLMASLLLLICKSDKLSRLIIPGYAIVFFVFSIMLCLTGYDKQAATEIFTLYFNVDSLNIIFLLVLSFVFFGVAIYNFGFIKVKEIKGIRLTYYSVGVLLFIFSMTGAILSSNLGLSWVFIEGTTLASAYLIYFDRTKHAIEAAWKYVFICSIGISLAFVGIVLLLLASGNLNSLFLNDLYRNALKMSPLWLKLAFVFFVIGIGTKAGLAPVHSWLPDAHSEAPSPISALLSATLLNVAFLIILRFFHLMELANLLKYAKILLLGMGILSIFITAIFVFNINNYKRMLAYSSIENMGIIVLGVVVGGLGLFAAIFHLIIHSLVKSTFFLSAGNILYLYETKKVEEVKSIISIDKLTGWSWILCFIAISGLPPFPLFISEFLLLKAIVEKKEFVLLAILVFLLTLIIYGIGKSVIKMSFGERAHDTNGAFSNSLMVKRLPLSMYVPQLVFILLLFILGIYLPPFLTKLIQSATLLI